MLKLAKRINELLAKPDVDGIVITHGTDTIEETAYFLNLVVKTEKPVVLVGVDAALHRASAPTARSTSTTPWRWRPTKDAAGRGVLVVMNDWIHGAHSLTKTSTTAVQTFMSPLRGPGRHGRLRQARVVSAAPSGSTRRRREFDVDRGHAAAARGHHHGLREHGRRPSSTRRSATGAKGIVIAGVGNGNMTKSRGRRAGRAGQEGVVCVRSSRVPTGQVGRNVEVDDDKLGLVASTGLNPQKARVLLRLALLKTKDPKTIQRYFDEY